MTDYMRNIQRRVHKGLGTTPPEMSELLGERVPGSDYLVNLPARSEIEHSTLTLAEAYTNAAHYSAGRTSPFEPDTRPLRLVRGEPVPVRLLRDFRAGLTDFRAGREGELELYPSGALALCCDDQVLMSTAGGRKAPVEGVDYLVLE